MESYFENRGSCWWKFDFHTHTPASNDYGKGADQSTHKEITPRDWLLNYMQKEIDCVAITDHNSGAWIDKLKNELDRMKEENPEGFRNIYLFPGVEISVNGGIHVLAIFSTEKGTSDIDSLLGAVEFTSSSKGSSDDVTNKSLSAVIEAIHKAGGIAIPAHVDKSNGLLETVNNPADGSRSSRIPGTTLKQALECDEILAMELFDSSFAKPPIYEELNIKWTEILGSDSHHPSGTGEQRFPGSHFTWVKMGIPSIEGVRLALLDGPLSIRRSDQDDGDPNERAQLRIESVEIDNARYMGRVSSFRIDFNPWLNTIIGGRGTGKSSLIEFVRLALQRVDELPELLKSEFEKYREVYNDRKEEGLLTNDSIFRVYYWKDDTRYRIQWSVNNDLDTIQELVDGDWERSEGDIKQRFPVRIYSQKQIFNIASQPLSLLRIVDESYEVNFRGWNERWKAEESRYLSLKSNIRELEASISEESRLRGELEDVKRKLEIFEKSGHAAILKRYQKSMHQQEILDTWESEWIDVGDQIRQVVDNIVPESIDRSEFGYDSDQEKAILDYSDTTKEKLEKISEQLNSLATEADKILSDWQQHVNQSSWKDEVNEILKEYQELSNKLSSEGIDDTDAYKNLVQSKQDIENRIRSIESKKEELSELLTQATKSLESLIELRRELTKNRKDFLSNVLKDNDFVRINVVPYCAYDAIESDFRRLIQRVDGGFERDIGSPNGGGLLGELYSNIDSSEDIENSLSVMKEKIRNIAENKSDVTSLEDRRFANHLSKLSPEVFDRLDTWFPEDSLEVHYSTTSDGEYFRPIKEGSPGQKTAALLAFLLSYGEGPLILDQPEDDLDNSLIYDLIVTQLREGKRKRQIIVVTHNANIVVNGDAELVIALVARGGQTQFECLGSLQERNVRDTICTIMEGGRDAFDQRYRRIALENNNM